MGNKVLSDFGNHVRKLRLENGLTQSALADRGLFDRNYIGMIERGERNPSLKTLIRLANALKVTLPDLLNFEEND